MPLLAAKAELLVLLCALGIALRVAALVPGGGFGVVVEGDVEEVFLVRVADLGALSFCFGSLAYAHIRKDMMYVLRFRVLILSIVSRFSFARSCIFAT